MPDDKELSSDAFISANKEIDVNAIMASIEKKIEEKKKAGVLKQSEIDEIVDMELLPLPDFLEIPNVYEPHLYPEHKFDDFQPYHFEPELEAGVAKKIMAKIRKISAPLTRFMIRPYLTELKNLTVKLHNENKEDVYSLKQMTPITLQSKEYIKLLHNAVNNMIVEISKQKIDQDLLKTKIKMLEDKIEFLENRERAIEKKVFDQ
jgi:hypothetical protein